MYEAGFELGTLGAGFVSKAYYGSGFFQMRIKLPDRDSAGVVTAFYLNLNGGVHDELDFEFMGNRQGEASDERLFVGSMYGNSQFIKGYRLEYSELREYTHGFFSNVAEILEDGMVQKKIRLLLNGGSDADPAKDINRKLRLHSFRKVLDHLLMLGIESQRARVAVRCAAFRCIGDLIFGHSQNLDILASKSLGDEPQVEPALISILQIILRIISMQEFIAADYVFKSFCEVLISNL
ncbi:golgin candidate 6 [Tanacetum coccineum]